MRHSEPIMHDDCTTTIFFRKSSERLEKRTYWQSDVLLTFWKMAAIFEVLHAAKSNNTDTLKVNWNAETSWPLSQDFEALKTVSKEFLRNSFSFSRYGPLKSSFLLIRKVSEKGRGNVRSIPRVTCKGAVTSEAIFGSLQVRFINDSELCYVPVARCNSSNLTWIWLHWARTVPKNISWMKNWHTCYKCGAK